MLLNGAKNIFTFYIFHEILSTNVASAVLWAYRSLFLNRHVRHMVLTVGQVAAVAWMRQSSTAAGWETITAECLSGV